MVCKTSQGVINKVYMGDGRKKPLKAVFGKKKKKK
jgi:hypothetical protein